MYTENWHPRQRGAPDLGRGRSEHSARVYRLAYRLTATMTPRT
jgi:hypothetical protein